MKPERTMLLQSVESFRQKLPDIKGMELEDLALILMTYEGIIRPNFLAWMAKTWTNCVSSIAASACQDNLLCEVRECHPQMLSTFVNPLRNTLNNERARSAVRLITREYKINGETATAAIDRLCSCDIGSGADGGSGLAVMATLENASIAFVPWLEEAAKRLGITDLTYTEKHGIADAAHAEQFLDAMEAESEVTKARIDMVACYLTLDLLDLIFHIHHEKFQCK